MKLPFNESSAVLIVDDEPNTLVSFEVTLQTLGINNVITCQDSRNVISVLEEVDVRLIFLDLIMPYVSGREILQQVKQLFPEIPVIIITGINEVESVVECLKAGAFDYIVKPVARERLLASVIRGLEINNLRQENVNLTRQVLDDKLKFPEAFAQIVTKNRKMFSLFKYCEAVAEGFQPILITGETGAGKELIAQSIHNLTKNKKPMTVVNVAGLDDQTFSDTLFGHIKGAFTGADHERPGLVKQAENGTLFLDEIGDLKETSQIKLLRFLENREYFPLGADKAKSSSAHVVVATNKNFEKAVAVGQFRKDLYYRLNTHHIHIPPLRERKDDIPLLLDYFIQEAADEFAIRKPEYSAELVNILQTYHFPGNIREFKSIVYDAVSTSRTSRKISIELIKQKVFFQSSPTGEQEDFTRQETIDGCDWVCQFCQLPTLKDASLALVQEAMRRANNKQSIAAAMLGITPQAMSQRLKRLTE
ncbi:MAG: sigma-54 dependent transcriptional regulator [Pseudomonadota bacterium]